MKYFSVFFQLSKMSFVPKKGENTRNKTCSHRDSRWKSFRPMYCLQCNFFSKAQWKRQHLPEMLTTNQIPNATLQPQPPCLWRIIWWNKNISYAYQKRTATIINDISVMDNKKYKLDLLKKTATITTTMSVMNNIDR